jgi:hypothetical protein
MSIPIDYKIDKIVKDIQAELKKEYGKDVPYESIVKAIEQQCKSTVKGMAEGDTVVWKYFGTYVATKKRVDALNKQYARIGKTPTLEDNGLLRLSFKRDGKAIASTEITPHKKEDIEMQGDWKYKYQVKEDRDKDTRDLPNGSYQGKF